MSQGTHRAPWGRGPTPATPTDGPRRPQPEPARPGQACDAEKAPRPSQPPWAAAAWAYPNRGAPERPGQASTLPQGEGAPA
eukprot:8371592-Alexandrium_andersonii.AAC.1